MVQIFGLLKDTQDCNYRKKCFIVKNIFRACLAIISGWCCTSKSYSASSKKVSVSVNLESQENCTDVRFVNPEELDKETGDENTMTGVPGFRYNSGRIPSGSYRHKSSDNYFANVHSSPLSRTESRSPSPVPSLPRLEKRRSTTPIMFSNSTGMMKPPPVQRNLECSLEELCYGCTKKIKVTRDVLTNTGQLIQEEEILTIKVKPGWKQGTKITFEGMGNERPGTCPADLTFVIAEKKHLLYRREGDDLEMGVEIPLVKALTGLEISIPLLDGQTMNLTIDDIIYPGYEKIIAGQGMPNTKEQGKRGNLKVVFLVEFPTEFTDEQREDIVNILQDSP